MRIGVDGYVVCMDFASKKWYLLYMVLYAKTARKNMCGFFQLSILLRVFLYIFFSSFFYSNLNLNHVQNILRSMSWGVYIKSLNQMQLSNGKERCTDYISFEIAVSTFCSSNFSFLSWH